MAEQGNVQIVSTQGVTTVRFPVHASPDGIQCGEYAVVLSDVLPRVVGVSHDMCAYGKRCKYWAQWRSGRCEQPCWYPHLLSASREHLDPNALWVYLSEAIGETANLFWTGTTWAEDDGGDSGSYDTAPLQVLATVDEDLMASITM